MSRSHRFAVALGVSCPRRIKWASTRISLAVLCALSAGRPAIATNGTWTSTSGGLWSDTMNWSGGTIFNIANGTDGIADFSTLNITANEAVHLDSARTIGQLKFGDTTPSNNWILDDDNNGGNILTLAVSSGSPTITVNNDVAAISLVLAGTQGLTKSGPGTLLLSGNNTYSGTTTISVGTLMLRNAHALGSTADGTTIASGATLDLDAEAVGAESLTIFGTGVGGNGALINSSASAASLSGAVTAGAAFTVGGTGDITLSGSVNSLPAFVLTKVGNNTLTLNGTSDNSNLGATVKSGTLVLAKASSSSPDVHAVGSPGLVVNGGIAQLGGTGGDQIIDVATVTVTSGAFDTNGQSETFATLNLQGTGLGNAGALINTAAGASTITPTNDVALTANATVGGTGDITINGSVLGNDVYVLTKTGNNTLTLSGATDDSGLNVTVNGGTVVLAKTSSYSPSVVAVGVLTVNGGTAQLAGTGGNQIYDFSPVTVTSGAFDTNGRSETILTLNLQGTGIGGAGALVNTAAAASVITPSNGTVLTGDATIGVTQSAGRITLNNSISGNFALTKVGPGDLILNGNNTFTGGVTINDGTLFLFNDGALNSSSPNSVAFGPGSTGVLDLGGHSVTVSGLTTDSNAGTPVVKNNFPNSLAVLTVNNSGFDTFAGTVQASRLSIAMAGSGTLELSGATDNPFLDVTVNSGTVILAKTSSSAPNDVHAIGGNGLTVNGGTAQLAGTGGDQIYDGSPVTVTSGTFDTNGRTETFFTLKLQGTGIGNAGALVNTAAAASAITPTNGTVLTGDATVGGAGDITLNGSVVGNSGMLTKLGNNTLTLSGTTDNPFLAVTVNSGTVVLAKTSSSSPDVHAIGGNGLAVNGGTAQLAGTGGDQIYDFSPVTVTSGVFDTNGQSETFGTFNLQGTGLGNAGALVNTAAGASTITLTNNVVLTANTTVGGTGDITINGTVVGNSSILTKVGNNTLTLGGTTDNTGLAVAVTSGTVVLAKTSSSSPDVHAVGGSLTINGGTARLAGSGGDQLKDMVNVTVNNGTFDTNGQSETFGALSLQGFGAGLAGALQDTATTASTLTPNGGTTLTANTLVGVTQGGSLTLNNAVVGNFSLVMLGPGTLTLTGTNSFSGGLTVQHGTLTVPTVNNASTSGPLGSNASVSLGSTFGGTGTLEYSGGNAATNMPLTLVSPLQTLSGGGAIQIDNPATSLTLSGTISGGGALSVYGPGTLFLTGTNTFNGGLTVQSGILKVGTVNNASNVGPLGPNQSVTLGSSGQTGTLELAPGPSPPPSNMPFFLAAGGVGGFQIDQPIANLTLIAPVDGAGGLVKSGPGALTLAGPNSFTGGVTINAGYLVLNNASALNSISPNAVAFGPASTGVLELAGNSVTVSGLSTGTPAGTPVVQNSAATLMALTVSNASDNTFAGALQDTVGGAALSLVKSGAGTLTLSGSKAYKGNTTVNAGTLRFALTSGSPTIGAGATASVASGATLELAGSVSALSSGSNRVNVNNGSSAPGLLVSGTHQQVGNIDGSGTTQVNAGSDLTANHIIQSALAIGGGIGSSGTVTIDASDALGNPLDSARGGPLGRDGAADSATDGGMSNAAFAGGPGNSAGSLPRGAEGFSGDPIPAGGGAPSDSPSVPEPSAPLLVGLALIVGFATKKRCKARCRP
jgi:fibronectin-binding autotransporter adhesin